MIFIARNSFIQVVKLHDVKGRINYISSHAKQENLYEVYETTERKFWRELAKYNQQDFLKSGTEGKCIEARELIIALPESFVEYNPYLLLRTFTEKFSQTYEVECVAALHHNKRKTNYHIHLIFSERQLLAEPMEKTATRNMYYDERGKHVRTKKEVTDEQGNLRNGCSVIRKGEVYERQIFSIKNPAFKSDGFPDVAKKIYTDLINQLVKNPEERLQIYDKNSPYLPMKKVGKNNPKAEQIEADNEVRRNWNQTVDRAYVSGVPETTIMDVKEIQIKSKIKESIDRWGNNPSSFRGIVKKAIDFLEIFIERMRAKVTVKNNIGTQCEVSAKAVQIKETLEKETMAMPIEKTVERPQQSLMASKYPRLQEIYYKLDNQNRAIYAKEQKIVSLEEELNNTKGVFKGKQRKELQSQIDVLKGQVASMKQRLSGIVTEHRYKNVGDFYNELNVARKEYDEYKEAVSKWEKQKEGKVEKKSVHQIIEQKMREYERNNVSRKRSKSYDRGAK